MQQKRVRPSLCLVIATVAMLIAYPVMAKTDLLLLVPALGTIEAHMILNETFDAEAAWEHYSNPNGVELGVENGVYRAYTMNEGFVWGLNQQEHSNVILEVDVTPLTINFENGFGVMCRADTTNNGDGYYFMINGNSYFSIRIGKGDEIVPLVDWTQSEAIHPEIDQNTIRAVCIDDNLAMYVNDELLTEVTDGNYTAGFAGFSIAAAPNTDMDVAFDNFVIYEITQSLAHPL